MELALEITPDYHGSIAVIDYTRETEYIDESVEDLLPSYTRFKFSETCTIDVLNRITSQEVTTQLVTYTRHDHEADSVRFPLASDGFYSVDHMVLPTVEWLYKVKDLDLSYYRNGIYVTDGFQCYIYRDGLLSPVEIQEVINVNPELTTISIASYKVFSIDRLKHCYINLARNILNTAGRCLKVDSEVRFNRDFLLMTITVINFYLEENEYTEAELVLEQLACYNLCDATNTPPFNSKPCGCHH
jgi:hypothetical protein